MEYVLLVGNTATIPPIGYIVYDTSNHGNDSCTTDHYYSTLEQSPESFSFNYPSNICVDFPDFVLGRFPFENPEQITNLVEKTLDYELDLNPGEWVRTNLYVNGQDLTYRNSSFDPVRPSPILVWENELQGITEGNLTVQGIVDFVQQGVGSIFMHCHACPSYWWLGETEQLSVSNAEQLSTSRIPVIFSGGCHSGKFDVGINGAESAAVKLLEKSDGGTVAVVAGTWYSPKGYNVYASAYNYAADNVVPQWRIPDADYHVGKAFYYYSALNPNDAHIILLGDPTLVLATAKYDLNVTQEKTPSQISLNIVPDAILTDFKVNVGVTSRSKYGNNLQNKTVYLYTIENDAKTPLATVTTDNDGCCNFLWAPAELESCNILAEFNGSASYYGSKKNVTLNFVTDNNQNVLTVESNSTVSELAYNPANKDLTFTVNGPDTTKGYIQVTVAKNLTADSSNIKMFLDSNQAEYSITQTDNSWIITSVYPHSSHDVLIDLDTTVIPEFSLWTILPLFIFVFLAVVIFRKKL